MQIKWKSTDQIQIQQQIRFRVQKKNSNKNKKHLENGTKETCKEGERKKSEMRIFYCQFFQTALF